MPWDIILEKSWNRLSDGDDDFIDDEEFEDNE
jgi:hypothetical protein